MIVLKEPPYLVYMGDQKLAGEKTARFLVLMTTVFCPDFPTTSFRLPCLSVVKLSTMHLIVELHSDMLCMWNCQYCIAEQQSLFSKLATFPHSHPRPFPHPSPSCSLPLPDAQLSCLTKGKKAQTQKVHEINHVDQTIHFYTHNQLFPLYCDHNSV